MSKASFNLAFPQLRPGGVYILEDWVWAHNESFQQPDNAWVGNPGLTNLVFELIMLAGSRSDIISRLVLVRGFVMLWRGKADLGNDFSLDTEIVSRGRRPNLI